VQEWLFLFGVIGLIVILIGSFGYTIYLLSIWYETIQDKRVERRKKDRDIITTQDGKVIVRDNDPHSVWRQIHLNPNPYVNGSYEAPVDSMIQVFDAFMSRGKKTNTPLLIEGQTKLRHVFSLIKSGVHFSLIGPTNAGKTMLANHLIDEIKADKSYALDPHAKFNTWSVRCEIAQSYNDIEHTLQQAFIEMTSRYDNGPGNYDSILLAIDEWPAIIAECPECENYIARISREGRKVNVRLILLSQSDQIGEIGLSVALRNNFIKVNLTPELTKQNQGQVKHWDKSIEIIELAGIYTPLSNEQKIIKLLDDGLSISEVVKSVYGSDGGKQREIVKGYLKQ
jgi:hypothetical protein